jgi:G3E family GTPase
MAAAPVRPVPIPPEDLPLAHTPVTILTGFLGSGKTTLLNRALRDPALARTAVVINEFGEISLDHALAAQSDDTIVVLENGCLCCTVFGDLVGTLNNLYHRREAGEVPPFDHVVIETSGLADPSPVVQAFLSDPTLAGLYRVGRVITVFDAVNGPGTLDRHDESIRQIALADHVLITKLDLVAPSDRAETEATLTARIRRMNPAAKISRIDDPALDVIGLLSGAGIDPTSSDAAAKEWLNLAAYERHDHDHDHDHHGHHHHHHRDGDIEAFAFIREEPTSRYALQLLLNALEQNLGPSLLRVKGLVNVAEEPGRPAVIQGAQHLLHNISWLDRWPDADHRTRIVFITQNISRAAIEEMINVLDRVATRTAKARERAQRS